MLHLILSIISLLSCYGHDGLQENPATGALEFRMVSLEKEIAMGEEYFYPFSDSCESAQEYVERVGQAIAAVSDRPDLPYEFVVTDESNINALSFPGGKILITRGFLLKLEDEAELAAILGHEIAHANLRHVAKGTERQVLFTAFPGVFEIMTELLELSYCRKEEYEADHYGAKYMTLAGYDPVAALDIMERLLDDRSAGLEWLSTHPYARPRLKALRMAVEEYSVDKELDRYQERYREMKDLLKKGEEACLER